MPVSPAPRTSRRPRLRQRLLLPLIEAVVTGKLRPGEKVNESRWAARLKVSRTPLREALFQLEREGLVRCESRGFTVEPLSAREVRETYPILAQLEGMAVRTSARFVLPLLPRLARINQEFARARNSARAFALDTLWHETLASQSRNARLTALLAHLRRAIRRYELFYMADARLVSASAAQHQQIIDAFQRDDVAAALRVLEENYLFGMQILLRKMGEE